MLDVRATWTFLGAALTPVSTLGWVIAGMVILYGLKNLMDRSGQPTPVVAHVLEAPQLNAARSVPRVGPASPIPHIEDPRR